MARLYRAGARKFLVIDIPAVGCDPYFTYTNNGECSDTMNQLFVAYNTGLKSHVTHLSEKLPGLTIIQYKTYDSLLNIIQNGEAYGFKDTKSACCGSGLFNAEVLCGRTTPQDLFCNDTNAYVFWDRVHQTEKVYYMFSQQIWSGNSSVIYPFNLSTLVSGKKASGF
ncbi:GDSL esterase/lipase At2g23540-like [Cryptomeria japonica]|uniref:GDSL esterase/lipase At2g23540-like n=1 Tax=Cryptomeria japonica TaxID=3369 RepID=UPI0027DA0C52|nr:GDSL esterase/lipase At2g23540-like [Cryptomeria japonica]